MDWVDAIGILVLLGPGVILAQKMHRRKKDSREVGKVWKKFVLVYYVVLLIVIAPVLLEAVLMVFLGG